MYDVQMSVYDAACIKLKVSLAWDHVCCFGMWPILLLWHVSETSMTVKMAAGSQI